MQAGQKGLDARRARNRRAEAYLSVVGARRSSATKQMSLFHRPARSNLPFCATPSRLLKFGRRVAPRSVTLVTAVSAMISSTVVAVDSTEQVQVISPTVLKRTERISTLSPAFACTSSDIGNRPLFRRTTSRL